MDLLFMLLCKGLLQLGWIYVLGEIVVYCFTVRICIRCFVVLH